MKTLKKLFAYLLAIVMCSVFLPINGNIASAEGEEIRLSLTSYISAYNAMRDSDTLDVEFGNVCWREGDSATFEVEAGEAGLYRIGINISGAEGYASKLTVTVNDTKQLDSAVAILHGNYFSMSDEEYGTIWLEEGTNIVTIEHEAGSAGAYATELFFKKSENSDIRMHVQSYTNAHNVKNTSPVLTTDGGPHNTVWFIGDWAEYHIYIPEAGLYEVGMKTAAGVRESLTFSFSVDGVTKLANVAKNTLNTTAYGEKVDLSFGQIAFFEAGEYTLKIAKNAGGFSYADEIFLKYAGKIEVDEIRVQMGAYTEAYSNTTNTAGLIKEGEFYVWRGQGATSDRGDWAKYSVDVPVSGKYKFGIKLGGAVGYTTGIRMSVDGQDVISNNEISILSEYAKPVDTNVGIIEFENPGTYEIELENTLPNSGVYTLNWYLIYLGDPIEFVSAYAGDELLGNGDEISAGTDLFKLEFSKKIKATDITNENFRKVFIKDSKGKKLSYVGTVEDEYAYLSLTEALCENEKYTLEIGAVSDDVEYTTVNSSSYKFAAVEGEGSETICNLEAEFENDCALISAEMLSSQELGIKGREYYIFMKQTDDANEAVEILSGVTDDGGKIDVRYTLPKESKDGEYTFTVSGKYTFDSQKVTAMYVSGSLKENIKNATAAGVKVGIYFFSQAKNTEEAVEEAEFVLENIKGYEIAYPVVFDTEEVTTYDARANGLTRAERTDCCIAFCEKIKEAGYTPMIYANTRYMVMGLELERLNDYDKWFAYYGTSHTFPYAFTMLQYSDTGRVPGIEGAVDLDVSFVDYAAPVHEE